MRGLTSGGGLTTARTRRRLGWLRIVAGLIAAGLVYRIAGVITGGHDALLLATVTGVAAALLRHDPEVQAGPAPRALRAAEAVAVLGAVAVLWTAPVAHPWSTSAQATWDGVASALLLTATVGMLDRAARATAQHAPTRSLLARCAEAYRAHAGRTISSVCAAAALLLTVVTARVGIPHGGLLALLLLLAPARLRLRDACDRLRTRADIRAALTGILKGGAWARPLELAGDSPLRVIDIDGQGNPDRVVLPLPPQFAAVQTDAIEAEVAHRLTPWGLFAVRLGRGSDRTAVATRIRPLPTELRFDGRAAVGGTEVWLGTGLATREHATATGTRGIGNGEPFDFRIDLRSEPHGIAVGLTGQGKSVTVSLIVQQLLLTGGWRAVMIDPKRVEFSQWVGRPGVLSVTTELDEHVAALASAREEMEARYRAMTAAGINNIDLMPVADRPPRLIVVVDEATELLAPSGAKSDEAKEINALKAQAAESIGSILRLGRAAGVHLLLAAQRADRAILSGEAQNNLAFKVLQGRSESIERTMIGLQDVLATPGVPGRAVARTLRIPQSEVQVAYTDTAVDLDRWLPVGGEPRPQSPSTPGAAESEAAQVVRRVVDLTKRRVDEDARETPDVQGDPNQPEYRFDRVEPFAPGEAQAELDGMIGLPGVRREVAELAASVQMEMERRRLGVGDGKINLSHLVFAGSPGTGKTTVARIVGSLLHDIGALPSGHVIETDRGDLVAQYLGQTAPRVAAAFDAAEGGLLFIDEAYSLANGDAFGREAIDTVVKLAEDRRGQVLVILAGYTNEMDHLLDQNPGLRSRFPTRITFEDYSDSELVEIARVMVSGQHRVLDRAADAALPEVIAALPRGKDWGNARSVRVLVELASRIADTRVAGLSTRTREDLTTITEPDLRAAAGRYAEGVARVDEENNSDNSTEARLQRLADKLLGNGNGEDDTLPYWMTDQLTTQQQ